MKFSKYFTPERTVIAGAILASLAYCRDLQYDFILDDIALILMNPRLGSWHNWKTLLVSNIFASSGPTVPAAVHYRPVYSLWLLLNRQLFGYVLPWWHLTSLLLHLVVTLLVFRLGVKVLRQWTAALGALLFAFHPIHAESVAYVAASTDLLVTLFLIAAILAYFEFRERQSWMWFAVSMLCSVLAMFSKENAVMLPFLIVAGEWFGNFPSREAGAKWRRFLWSLPYFGVVAAYLVTRTMLFGPNLGPGPGESRIRAVLDSPLVLLVYFKKLFWPTSLSFFYPIEWSSQWTTLKVLGLAATLAIILVLWFRQQPRSASRLLLVWTAILFAVPMGSVLTFLKEDWVHDRHMYVVSVPLCLLLAAVIVSLPISRRAMLAVSSSIVAALLVLLVLQVPKFQDEDSIYSNALRVSPDSVLAHQFYATALWTHGKREQAFREFRRVIELTPNSASSHESYAGALEEAGQDQEALAEYQAALRLSPRPSRYRAYLLYRTGSLELDSGNASAGMADLQEAVKIDPRTLNYHGELARAFAATGRTEEAAEQDRLEAAVRADAIKQGRARAR